MTKCTNTSYSSLMGRYESEARRECDRQLGNLTPLETLEAVKNKTRFASIASEAWARVDKSENVHGGFKPHVAKSIKVIRARPNRHLRAKVDERRDASDDVRKKEGGIKGNVVVARRSV